MTSKFQDAQKGMNSTGNLIKGIEESQKNNHKKENELKK